MCDAVAERRDAAVVTALAEFGPAVGLVRHPGRPLERRPLIPVADVEEVEDAAHEILPAIAVERRSVAAPVRLEPLRRLRGQVHVHGLGNGREEEVRRRRVVVHEDLRPPPQHPVHHGAHFRLALGQQVAVHVEAVVAVAPRDAPGLVLFERPRVVRAHADGVVPRGETLVTIGIRRWVEDHDHRLQDLEGLRLVGGSELVGHLHGGFESRRFVAVDRVLEHRYGRALRRDRGRPRRRGFARIGQLRQAGANLIELREVLGIGNDQRPNRPVLGRASPRLDADAVARGGDQGVEIVLHHCVHGVLVAGRVAGDRFRAGDRRLIGAARVEVEQFLGGERGYQDDQKAQNGAHGIPDSSARYR